MITQLAHLCIHAADLDETARFYVEAMGLEKGFEFIKDNQLFGYYIKLGNNTFIEVFKGEPGGPGNIDHLAIETDDIDAVIARIKAHGYAIGEKTLGADHSWQVWTSDPDGVRIEFHEYTPRSMQLNGGSCPVDW
jgi:catechol 2,3-dioxygenase-like lactoylglutathione lyase family enzyme